MKRPQYFQFASSIAGSDFAFQAGDVVELAVTATSTSTWRGWRRAGIVERLDGVPTRRTPVRTIDPAYLEPRTPNVTPRRRAVATGMVDLAGLKACLPPAVFSGVMRHSRRRTGLPEPTTNAQGELQWRRTDLELWAAERSIRMR
jgi:hypothetical protein